MRTPPHPSRRTLLAGAGAVALVGSLTACDLPGPGGTSPADRDAPEPGRTDADVDVAHVRTAAARTSELLTLLGATVGAHPRLRDRLAPLESCHRAHLEALGQVDDSPSPEQSPEPSTAPSATSSPGPSVTPAPARALRRVVSRETALAQELVGLAGSADSGTLARLLATMGAGVHMHLEALAGGEPS